MCRRLFLAVLLGSLCLGFAADAKAVFITSTGTIEAKDLTNPAYVQPPIVDIKWIDGTGVIFTNQVSGTPFVSGGEIRSVAIHVINLAQNGTQQPIGLPDGSSLVVVSAIRGQITTGTGSGIVTANFTQGRTFFMGDTTGFNTQIPSTWNFANAFAEYAMAAAQDVLGSSVNNASGSPWAATLVNESAVNLVAGQSAQGRFLFTEDSTAAQNAGATPGLGAGTGGDNFLTALDVSSEFPDLYKAGEGFFANIAQTVDFGWTTALSDADLAMLNAIAAASFSDSGAAPPLGGSWGVNVDLDPGTTGVQGFASRALGQPTDFLPAWGVAPTGDFKANLYSIDWVGITAVPEPMSMAVWGIFSLLGTAAAIRQRTRKR